MKLNDLLDCGLSIQDRSIPDPSVEIASVEYDSRAIRSGALFVAVKGFQSDGHDYIENACTSGALACIVSVERFNEFSHLIERGIQMLAGLADYYDTADLVIILALLTLVPIVISYLAIRNEIKDAVGEQLTYKIAVMHKKTAEGVHEYPGGEEKCQIQVDSANYSIKAHLD